ncbi:MAG: ATP-binding protein [Eubacteriaceae bacterium]|jgi:predicted HTH transcriptional regulator|nr:ATP-binding protein [Eubacteriaceae bacterium]
MPENKTDNIIYGIDLSKPESFGEDTYIEAKASVGGLPESIWETYSAFANTKGGIILLGVAENKDKSLYLVDLPAAEALVMSFKNAAADKRVVSCNVMGKEDISIRNVNGNHIVILHIPKAKRCEKPVYIGKDPYSGSYYRLGESDMKMSREQVKKNLTYAKLSRAFCMKKCRVKAN